MTNSPSELIGAWLRRQLPAPSVRWFEDELAKLVAGPTARGQDLLLGLIPRRLGKADLLLEPSDLAAARRARAGWDPTGWSVDEAARIRVLRDTEEGPGPFAERFTVLCRSADVAEAVALYRGLPLYPASEALDAQAAEGVRTNMRSIFEAVAHRNPYPRERFDQNRWNQMVLKALFIGSALAPIQGLDERANAELAQILSDYAHERWAAGRPVTPELWRCIGPFAEGAALADLERVVRSGDETERKAAALALSASPDKAAGDLLKDLRELAAAVAKGDLTWDVLARDQ